MADAEKKDLYADWAALLACLFHVKRGWNKKMPPGHVTTGSSTSVRHR